MLLLLILLLFHYLLLVGRLDFVRLYETSVIGAESIVIDLKSQRIVSSPPRQIKLTYAATNTGTGRGLSFNDELYVGYLKKEYASRHYLTFPISVALHQLPR